MKHAVLVCIVSTAACAPDYALTRAVLDAGTAGYAAGGEAPTGGDASEPGADGAPGGIEGQICAPDGESWVAGARVFVTLPDGTVVESFTNGDGRFLLEGLPPGVWTVTVEKGSFTDAFDVRVIGGEVTGLATRECLPAGEVRIAVVTGDFDTIEHVIDDLGFVFDLVDGRSDTTVSLLLDPARLAEYDLLFFDCGHGVDLWWPHRDEVAANLRRFVQAGGSIYASDWAYAITEVGWPDMADHPGADDSLRDTAIGADGVVIGRVLDPAMVATLGADEAEILYDVPGWVPITAVGTGEALIAGTYVTEDPETGHRQTREGPLAVRLRDGEGQVLYTTFHNDAQATPDVKALLREVILSL